MTDEETSVIVIEEDSSAVTNGEPKTDQEIIADLQKENAHLKMVLSRILPPPVTTAKANERKRSRPGSLFKNSTNSGANVPLGIILAADNTKRGQEFIKVMEDLVKENMKSFSAIEAYEYKRHLSEREKLKTVDYSQENYPKKIIQVFPNTTVDKSIPDIDYKADMSLRDMVKLTDRHIGTTKAKKYLAEDDMEINCKTEEQRQKEKQKEIDDMKKELFELKKKCFNCGKTTHRKSDCKERPNQRLTGENYDRLRELTDFLDNLPTKDKIQEEKEGQGNGKEANPSEPKRKRRAEKTYDQLRPVDTAFKPGTISDELREALGLQENDLPQHVYNMRKIGYPIGWLKHIRIKQNKPLAIINSVEEESKKAKDKLNQVDLGESDGEVLSDQEELAKTQLAMQEARNYYDLFKFDYDNLIQYPGYNIEADENVIDKAEEGPDSDGSSGEIVENYPEYNEENHILRMREHLHRMNNMVNAKLGLGREKISEFIPDGYEDETNGVDAAEESSSEEEEAMQETETAVPRVFEAVTPLNPDNKLGEKGVPSLEAFSVGVAPFERNFIDESLVKKGTFKKISKLLNRRKLVNVKSSDLEDLGEIKL